jgi:oligosaccharide repeat unit polymerase
MSLLTIALLIILAALALAIRRRAGSWTAPAAFFPAVWTLFAGLPVPFGPIPVAPLGMAFVVVASLSVFAGAQLASRRWKLATPAPIQPTSWPLLEWLIVVSTVAGLVAILLILASRGRGLEIFLSPVALQTAAHDYASAIISRTWQLPYGARLLITGNYLGALLVGMMFGLRRDWKGRWVFLAALLPSAFTAYLLTTKASLLIPLALLGGAYLATRISAPEPLRPTVGSALLAAVAVVVLGGYFVIVHMSRYEYHSFAGALKVVNIFAVNLFPYMGVFAAWLQHGGWATAHPGFGTYSFAGTLDLLHIANRAPGQYASSAYLPGVSYNIYTAFRGLIEDFTLPGALLVLGVIGFGAQRAYLGVRAGDLRYAAPLAGFYAFVAWSFIVNIFSYNTIIAAFVLFAAYLWLAAKPSVGRVAARLDTPWRGVAVAASPARPVDT